MQPIRIQKALSEAGVASRRAAEELVRQGRVTINGRKAEIGQSVNPDRDVIAVDGKRVYFARKKQYRYIMMNKPRGYVTTLSDELGRRCVTDLLTGVEERVYPIGWTAIVRDFCSLPMTASWPTALCTRPATSIRCTA